jgi:hypothetical protein
MPNTPSPVLRAGPSTDPPQANDRALATRLLALFNTMRLRLGEVVMRRAIVETDLVVGRTCTVAGRPVPSTSFPATSITALVGLPSASSPLVVQGGSNVGSVDANSTIAITFPAPFRRSLIAVLAMNGDANVNTNLVFSLAPSLGAASLSQSGRIRVWDANLNAGLTLGTNVRVSWLAVGT